MAVPSRQALKKNLVCPDLRKGAGTSRPWLLRQSRQPAKGTNVTTFDELRLAEPLLRALRAEAIGT